MVAVAPMPEHVNGASICEIPRFHPNGALPYKVADRAVRDPVEELVFKPHFKLAGEEHAISVFFKEGYELNSRLPLGWVTVQFCPRNTLGSEFRHSSFLDGQFPK